MASRLVSGKGMDGMTTPMAAQDQRVPSGETIASFLAALEPFSEFISTPQDIASHERMWSSRSDGNLRKPLRPTEAFGI